MKCVIKEVSKRWHEISNAWIRGLIWEYSILFQNPINPFVQYNIHTS